MANNPHLGIPILEVPQANAEVILNEFMIVHAAFSGPGSVIDKDLAIPPGSPTDGDRYVATAVATAVTDADHTNGWFKVGSDVTGEIIIGDYIEISGSTANDGTYRVILTAFAGGKTQIDVAESLVDSTGDGNVNHTETGWNNNGRGVVGDDGMWVYYDGSWYMGIPNKNHELYMEDEAGWYHYDGSAWVSGRLA